MSFKYLNLFIGAGDGWYTWDTDTGEDKFAICNLELETTKKIKETGTYSIPLTGQLVFNPAKQQMFILAGFTF